MNRLLILVIIALIVSSCTTYKEYAIEVYQPSEIVIPPGTEDVAIVYRNFKYPADTLRHYYQDNYRLKKAKKDPVKLDSILVDGCIKKLAQNLKSQKLFNEIHIYPELFEAHSAKKLPPLNFDLVSTVTTSSHTDLLVSLETFSYFYSKYSSTADIPSPSNEVITAAIWAVYNPYTQQLVERKTMIDTIFWNAYDEKGNYLRNSKLPPRLTALKTAAQIAGENYSKRFSSSWQKVNRTYIVPSTSDFSTADEHIQKKEWDKAISLWEKYANHNSYKKAIHARYNLAFGFEMKDDLDIAQKWLVGALQLATEHGREEDVKMILSYQKILAKRQKDIARLNQR